ncbi:MAG: glycosyltransferase [Chloroflexi bacterium]|nr:glycosyltransferase [Chloroflexota bacterium]
MHQRTGNAGGSDVPSDSTREGAEPLVSIVMPAYNEEDLLERSVSALMQRLDATLDDPFEVIICENGSTDRTLEIAHRLSEQRPQIRVEHLPRSSYGQALRHGIAQAQGRDVVLFYVDFWNASFLQKAIGYLTYYDVVVGSKTMRGARDRRPWPRRLISRGFNLVLRMFFGFQGTDAHGIKAFNRQSIEPVVAQCLTDGEAFDSELVIRAQRSGLRYRELPVEVREWRPTRYSMSARIAHSITDLFTLRMVLRQSASPTEELLKEERM